MKTFTIQKTKLSTKTQEDFENILITIKKEKSVYDTNKKEVILKENGELFTVPNFDEVKEDVRNYLQSKDDYDPFTKSKASFLNKKLNQNLK